tara:strand:- start:688 stop:1236 length:549 start_codon:yes stop_codon:yes gene_type:complete
MKMFVQRTAIGAGDPFELAALKAHLRVDDDSDDAAITNMGRTASAELEHFAQIALLRQTIHVTILGPTMEEALRLPVGPGIEGAEPTIAINGQPFTDFLYIAFQRPVIVWGDGFAAVMPQRVDIEYPAGFGDAAASVPHDLAQALMDQTALHYDGRSPMDAKSLTTSPHMARIGAKYRGVQL